MAESHPVCDAPAGLIALDEAIARLVAGMVPVRAVERVGLDQARGRVLANDLLSTLDLPPFTASAMDGYALRAEDAVPGAWLRVTGTALAGRPHTGVLAAGDCTRVFTGACLPPGADAVVIQEEASRERDGVRLQVSMPVLPGANVRLQGEELTAGTPLLLAGTRLGPAEVGLLATVGCAEVDVLRRPRVALFVTGDELCEPGQPLSEGSIYESNRPVMRALLSELGMVLLDFGIVRDDREALRQALARAAAEADVILTAGGASVGEADFVVDTLRELGRVAFWKVAIKPGKPFVCGRIGDTPVMGLPGNPVSMMVTFDQLARPALLTLAGLQPPRPLRLDAVCSTRLRKSPGRLEFQRGRFREEAGQLSVVGLRGQGSHRLTSMSLANCYIVLPVDSAGVEPGERVVIEPFGYGLHAPATAAE
jgi:molybdopterin molybdotransferase